MANSRISVSQMVPNSPFWLVIGQVHDMLRPGADAAQNVGGTTVRPPTSLPALAGLLFLAIPISVQVWDAGRNEARSRCTCPDPGRAAGCVRDVWHLNMPRDADRCTARSAVGIAHSFRRNMSRVAT